MIQVPVVPLLPSLTVVHEIELPGVPSFPLKTDQGVSYFNAPGAQMLFRTAGSQQALAPFLEGFDPELKFLDYLNDPVTLTGGAAAAKTGGQLCYLSFGEGHTPNEGAQGYLNHIKSSGHGSVLEHAGFTILLWGVSRSFTHELVRHRVGMGFSQVSQRYVGETTLRFVERPEFVTNRKLHDRFCTRIQRTATEYGDIVAELGHARGIALDKLTRSERTAARKALRQASRACLTNEVEAPIQVTGNGRAWRNFLDQRGTEHAEPEIRRVAFHVWQILNQAEPLLFGDYEPTPAPDGIGHILTTSYRKV